MAGPLLPPHVAHLLQAVAHPTRVHGATPHPSAGCADSLCPIFIPGSANALSHAGSLVDPSSHSILGSRWQVFSLWDSAMSVHAQVPGCFLRLVSPGHSRDTPSSE